MNPLLLKAIPYALAASIGFGLSWGIQGLRITSVKQEFTAYKQEQTRIIQEHKDRADKQRNESALAYEAAKQQLSMEIEAGDVYRRCVAAGRCGVRVVTNGLCKSAGSTGNGVQAISGNNANGGIAVPATGEPSAETVCEELANGAARVQLQLNQLQAEIEGQEGY